MDNLDINSEERDLKLKKVNSSLEEYPQDNNPEEDGLKALKMAYEEALNYYDIGRKKDVITSKKDIEQEKKEETIKKDPKEDNVENVALPSNFEKEIVNKEEDILEDSITLFVKKLEKNYKNFENRINKDTWIKLFKEFNIKDNEKIEEKFLTFIRTHYFFPREVWKTFNNYFNWTDNLENLYIIFPKTFVNDLIGYINNPDKINFKELLNCEKGLEDIFINKIYSLREAISNEDIAMCEEIIEDAKEIMENQSDLQILSSEFYILIGEYTLARKTLVKLFKSYNETIEGYYKKANILISLGFPSYGLNLLKTVYVNDKNYLNIVELLIKCNLMLNDSETAMYYCTLLKGGAEYTLLTKYSSRMYLDYYNSLKTSEITSEEILYLAEAHKYLGDVDEALKLLEKQYKTGNFDLGSTKTYLNCLLDKKQSRKAYDLVIDAINKYPEDYEFYLIKGKLLASSEKYKEALDNFNLALKLNNNSAEIYNSIANVLNSLGNYEEALENINKAEKINSYLESLYLTKVTALIGMERYNEAIDTCNKALQINDKMLDIYILKTQMLIDIKEYSEAIGVCIEAIDKGLVSAKVYYEKARASFYLNRKKEAIEACKKAIEIDGKDSSSYLLLGKIYFKDENYDDAIDYFKTAIDMDVFLGDAYLYLSRCYEYIRNTLDAIRVLDDAINLKLDNIEEFYYRRGCLLLQLNRNEEAILEFKKAIYSNEGHYDSCIKLGEIYNGDGQYEEAIPVLEKAISIRPEDLDSFIELSKAYINLNKYDDCVKTCDKGLKINGSYDKLFTLYLNKTVALVKKQDFYKAEISCINALTIKDTDNTALRLMIDILRGKGDYAEALEAYNDWHEATGKEDPKLKQELQREKRKKR